jgi:ATP-dependent helicase/nuclease subunit A
MEERQERKRLLYVAATRAADHLILSSSLEACDKPHSNWMHLLAERFDLENGQLVAPLPDAYDVPKVRVTIEPTADSKPHGKTRGPNLLKLLDEAHLRSVNGDARVPFRTGPIAVDHGERRTFSVSRLTGQLLRPELPQEPTSALDQPEGSNRLVVPAGSPRAAPFDPRGFGSLVHEVLARLDFRGGDKIADWCEHLAPLHVPFHAAEAAREARLLIEQFVASPAGRRLADAAAIHREVEFLLAWPPGEGSGATAHIRGFIDCLYQDRAGHWRLVDYKTNHIAPADVVHFAGRYEMQLGLYAIAAERALGQQPLELALHFLRADSQHTLPWNDAARRRAIDMVNHAVRERTTEQACSKAVAQDR